jgi:putative nucleotidyltransferase with HDIG domain
MSNPPDHTGLVQLPISQLKIGMFVAKLDKDWLESRFLYQGFVIENINHIDALAEECETVWIDPKKAQRFDYTPSKRPTSQKTVKSERISRQKSSSAKAQKISAPFGHKQIKPATTLPKKSVNYENQSSIAEESQKSYPIFKQARISTRQLFKLVGNGDQIDSEQAKAIIESCMESILRNPSAMMWMSKIRSVSEYTVEHSLNVCVLAIAFGRNLGFTKQKLYNIGLCGLLHDVGKMRLPANVLDKAEKLTEKEWKQIKAHAYIGGKLLEESKAEKHVITTAYQHHERIDGKGYPLGLAGEDIALYSKMISLVDSFDAMTAQRCYSDAMTPSAAIREIFKHRGEQFDTELALEFIKTIGLYPPGTVVELVNGYLGLVIERSDLYRHLPKILLLKDESGNKLKQKVIDLTLTESKELGNEFLVKKDHPNGYQDIFLENYRKFIQKLGQ